MSFPHSSSPAASIANKPLKGETVALLVASGFDEDEMTKAQRALIEAGAKIKIVSTEQGVAQAWHDNVWGHYFAVEAQIAVALAADYSMVLVPGGQRSMDKLKNSAHTARFLKGFLAYGKPVVFFNDAVQLLAHVGLAAGKTVTGPAAQEAVLTAAGATWSPEMMVSGDGVLSAQVNAHNFAEVIAAAIAHFQTIPDEFRMAA